MEINHPCLIGDPSIILKATLPSKDELFSREQFGVGGADIGEFRVEVNYGYL